MGIKSEKMARRFIRKNKDVAILEFFNKEIVNWKFKARLKLAWRILWKR